MNPATYLRALGPEPWNVAYVEPSVRPDDGRYGENPNRLYTHTQYQIILKPAPENSQELYLDSLAAIGVDQNKHDIRFVEDNWAQPAIGAWGLGWEVWLDGLEITQYTYFQQVGGIVLDPVCLELTYGLERIAMALQGVRNVFDLMWDQKRSYGDVRLQDELERSKYAFDYCEVEFLQNQFNAIERECKRTIGAGLVLPAYDYVLQLSNIFNLLDSRGAVGVTERQRFLGRTRDLAKEIAALYVKQREEMGYPWLRHTKESAAEIEDNKIANLPPDPKNDARPSTVLLEIGFEELPAHNVSEGRSQLEKIVPLMLKEARLAHGDLKALATPRRLAVLIKDVAPRQNAVDEMVKGPGVKIAFDKEGNPTQAAVAFAKRFKTDVKELVVVEDGKSSYVYAKHREEGEPAVDVLASLLPQIIGKLSFEKTMRWNASQVAFPRPIQWLVALFGSQLIKFQYAGAHSGATSYGSRGEGAPKFEIPSADDYQALLTRHQIIADVDLRRAEIMRQIDAAAASIEARVEPDDDLLDEVTNLVEQPAALLASFDESFLEMPSVILKKVMRSKQRYFTLLDAHTGAMRPNFITIRNGPARDSSKVIIGNENVVYARFADAAYFYRYDVERPLESLLPKLDTLTFQAKLGSMLDKTRRIESLIGPIGAQLKAQNPEIETASRAAHLCKADLVTKMVVEMTSLQGVMGRIYHLRQGGAPAVADAIFEHYLPRFAGDDSPKSTPGLIVALADKLDSIAGLFAVGLEPKGNADPFALRRAAIGVVQGLVDNAAATFSLRQALTAVRSGLPAAMSDDAFEAALRFIIGRQRASLLEAGHRHDVVEAVVNVKGEVPYEAQRFVEQLGQIVKRDDWPTLLAAYSRCARIIKSSGVPAEDLSAVDINDVEPATSRLSEKLSSLTRPGDIKELAALLATVEPLITDFFNKVLVNAEDPGLRRMRLSLVSRVVELANGIVDFSKVEGF
jgi:glycyl-tRNA synthetase